MKWHTATHFVKSATTASKGSLLLEIHADTSRTWPMRVRLSPQMADVLHMMLEEYLEVGA